MRTTASLLALALPMAAQAPKAPVKKVAPRPAKAGEAKSNSPVVARWAAPSSPRRMWMPS